MAIYADAPLIVKIITFKLATEAPVAHAAFPGCATLCASFATVRNPQIMQERFPLVLIDPAYIFRILWITIVNNSRDRSQGRSDNVF